jgi:hypothetical protein
MGHDKRQATKFELVSPQKGAGISHAFELFFDTAVRI